MRNLKTSIVALMLVVACAFLAGCSNTDVALNVQYACIESRASTSFEGTKLEFHDAKTLTFCGYPGTYTKKASFLGERVLEIRYIADTEVTVLTARVDGNLIKIYLPKETNPVAVYRR